MLEKFQSVTALTDQIDHQQYHYFMIKIDEQLVGYNWGVITESGV